MSVLSRLFACGSRVDVSPTDSGELDACVVPLLVLENVEYPADRGFRNQPRLIYYTYFVIGELEARGVSVADFEWECRVGGGYGINRPRPYSRELQWVLEESQLVGSDWERPIRHVKRTTRGGMTIDKFWLTSVGESKIEAYCEASAYEYCTVASIVGELLKSVRSHGDVVEVLDRIAEREPSRFL